MPEKVENAICVSRKPEQGHHMLNRDGLVWTVVLIVKLNKAEFSNFRPAKCGGELSQGEKKMLPRDRNIIK